MKCPLCLQYFTNTNFVFMSNHLRQVHHLHSSCDVIARAMFKSSTGYEEAVQVLKDFEMRDQTYKNLQLQSRSQRLFNQVCAEAKLLFPNPNKQVPSTSKCDQIVQTEETVIKEEKEVNDASRNVYSKSKEEMFGEYWEEGKFTPPSSSQNSVFATLTVEENEIFDKLGEILESQNKETATLKSQLILSKESEGFFCEEIETLKNRLEELEQNVSTSRSANESKDLEIFTLNVKIKDSDAKNSELTKTLAAANKLLDENEKKVKADEQKGKEQDKYQQVLLENTRKSLDDLLEINTSTKNKVVEAVMNTKTACKFMVREVTKKFEEFETEMDTMNGDNGKADFNDNVKVKRLKLLDYGSEEATNMEDSHNNQGHTHDLGRKRDKHDAI